MKKAILLLIIFLQALQVFAQDSIDVAVPEIKNDLKFKYEALIIPATLVGFGVIGLESETIKNINSATRNEIKEHIDEKLSLDDFSQYAPFASVYALNAFGINGKNNFKDPKNLTALQNVPLAYVGKKEYKKAIKAYGDLEKVDKDNPEIYYGMGVVYFENIKDNEKALENMCKAYILYIAQNSPYRTDAENVIQKLYSEFKQNGQIEKFNQILNLFNITPN